MSYFQRPRLQRAERLTDRLARAAYQVIGQLTVTAWVTPEPVPYDQRTSGTELQLVPGQSWGRLFDCAWFHFTGTVPAEAAGAEVVALIDVSGEALVVDETGHPVRGLTNVSSGYDYSLGAPGKRVVPLFERAAGGEAVDLWADAGANDLFGVLKDNGELKQAALAVRHPNLHALWYDVEVLWDLVRVLPGHSAQRAQIETALVTVADQLEANLTDDAAAGARKVLAPLLAQRAGDPSLTVTAIGHAHMDLAWLWPIRETIRKGARTFATALRHMERYPDYHFGASQPQYFQWMKDHYPRLYEEIGARVAEGRLEVQGAMWVESDTNVPAGESLVRQLLYGKRFWRDEFGIDAKGLWLPDVFGYSAALPQLLRSAQLDWFMTQKLSWSLVNTFPHKTFRWTGLDGTTILAHLLPEDTYNSPILPRSLAKTESNYPDRGLADEALLLFGIGDGGGGPGEEHLERLERLGDLAGLPRVRQDLSQHFFERLVPQADRFPVWDGELYLERHQGTYTTQARNKRYNRKLELALREAELAAARALWAGAAEYPAADFERIWKEVLLYQFHDILPGSSITRVYDESLARYAVLLAETEALRGAAETAGDTQPVVVNSLGWERTEWLSTADGWRRVTVPAFAATALAAASAEAPAAPTASAESLENEHLRVTFAADGSLASVWDKDANREVLDPVLGGNRLLLWPDDGDAWDIPYDYEDLTPDRPTLAGAEASVDGPRAVVRQRYTYGGSTIEQDVVLVAGSRRLDFVTRVDWRGSARMLRTEFALGVRARHVNCEVQYGQVERPTHQNTTWDLAQFEICAHRYIDLSDGGYGVALLNDSKYGHKARGHVLDINLLRSPHYPDPVADRAEHEFTYSLYPHTGGVAEGGVVRAGWELNQPLRQVEGTPADSWLAADHPGVVIDAVKRAEDSDALIIRLYEAHGAWCRTTLRLPAGTTSAELVDILEERPEPLAIVDGALPLELTPYAVRTLRLSR